MNILRHLKLWDRPERPAPRVPDRSIRYDPDVPGLDQISQWPDAAECGERVLLVAVRDLDHVTLDSLVGALAISGDRERGGIELDVIVFIDKIPR